jgi:prepilin-type N-terminal cleavage/methylation domain-containing protein
MPNRARARQAGFSLIELMMVLVIFLLVSGAIFGLLNVAQIRYRSEQQILDALQGARIGLEQITRDVYRAGYPPSNAYSAALATTDPKIAVPFVGIMADVVDMTCTVDTTDPTASTCQIPSPWDLIIETDTSPEDGAEQVEWIRYRIANPADSNLCTLYRGEADKTAGGDPTEITGSPLAENLINRTDATCDTDLADPDNAYVFTYVCAGGATSCTPDQIVEVYIELQARPIGQDLQTGQIGAITLRGAARRLNPNQ